MTSVKNIPPGGYMTVYLALTVTVIIALCLALIEGCRYRGISLETECVMDIGMDSILAEYHRELQKQYNLFAIDCSYGSENASTELTERHLLEYMNRNFSLEDVFLEKLLYRDFFAIRAEEAQAVKAAFLTDGGGDVFRQVAVNAVEDAVGIGLLQQLTDWLQIIESRGLERQDVAGQKQQIDAQIREYDGKETADGKTIHIENPTAALEEKRKEGLLKLVTEEDEVSTRRIETETLLEKRMERGEINCGNLELGTAGKYEELEELKEKVFFHEYLLRYLGRYGQEKQDSPLWYQTEYVIIGKDNDLENLKGVVNRIFIIREATNTLYLTGCEEKYAIAEALGEVLAAAMMVPEISGLLTATLILGWAFAESVYDVKELLAGEKIPLLKEDSSWHYGLSSALQGELSGTAGEENGNSSGMGYEDYLRVFLLLCEEGTVTCRAMNVVEMDIRNTPGNSAFRLDACIAEIAMNVKVKSKYGYSFEIERQKSYIRSLETTEGR